MMIETFAIRKRESQAGGDEGSLEWRFEITSRIMCMLTHVYTRVLHFPALRIHVTR